MADVMTWEEIEALDGDVGIQKTFTDGVESRDVICPADVWDRLVATALHFEAEARAGIEDRERAERAREHLSAFAYNGCFTGDCPHETTQECVDALSKFAAEAMGFLSTPSDAEVAAETGDPVVAPWVDDSAAHYSKENA